VSALAGGLLIPYIIWVGIAAYLNLHIYKLNR
jgi:tryptophan-rich sensory protein